jgi:hypothetical protein
MKNMLHFFRQGIIILLLGSSLPSFSQSFQNTLLGINNDDYVAGVAVSMNYWIMGNTNSFTPSLGTEHMLFSKYNGNTGASIWDRKYYSATNTAIQFTAYGSSGGYANFTTSPGNSVPPLPCNFTACSVFGPTVNKIGDPKSNKYFYVSGFWKDPVFGVRRLVVLKILTNGNIAWARTNVIAGVIYDEAGVSVESCPNGDVIVVSQVTNAAGQVYPAITRLSFNGTLLWRFFYQPATFEQPYNYIPHQSCIYRQFLNGNVNDPIGIAITGECNQAGVPGSSFFVMRVAYNGGMIWKNCYPMVVPSGAVTFDTGWDIMVEDETLGGSGLVDNFVVTGLSNEFGAGPIAGALGFMSRVTTGAGAFVNCHRFGVPVFRRDHASNLWTKYPSKSNRCTERCDSRCYGRSGKWN